MLFNLKSLLELYDVVGNIILDRHQEHGDKSYDQKQEEPNSKKANDVVRCSDRKELDKYDNETERRDRRDISRDSNRTCEGSRVV